MENELSKLLSNHDLENYCKMLKIKLNNINYKDKIKINTVGAYIINLDHSSPLDGFDGTHWVALYITDTEALYFDSYGFKPPPIVLKKLRKFNSKLKIIINHNQYQTIESVFCGWYCLLFLYMCNKNSNAKMRTILGKIRAKFHYDEERYLNDSILQKNIKRIFSIL